MGLSSTNSFAEVAATTQTPEDHVICHECEGRMVLSYADHPYRYHDLTLTLKNLPYWQCTECDDEMYGMGTLRTHLIRAREHYDATGETIYDCIK